MRRRDLVLALSAAGMASSTLGSNARASGPPAPTAGQNLDMTTMALPIAVNGRLLNYIFVAIRINLTASADIIRLRAREPYFRDTLIRAAHRTPFTVATDYNRIDQVRLKAAVLQTVAAFGGPRAVSSVVVMSESPRHRVPIPRPPAAGPAITASTNAR